MFDSIDTHSILLIAIMSVITFLGFPNLSPVFVLYFSIYGKRTPCSVSAAEQYAICSSYSSFLSNSHLPHVDILFNCAMNR